MHALWSGPAKEKNKIILFLTFPFLEVFDGTLTAQHHVSGNLLSS
jgi:hypothetical protein